MADLCVPARIPGLCGLGVLYTSPTGAVGTWFAFSILYRVMADLCVPARIPGLCGLGVLYTSPTGAVGTWFSQYPLPYYPGIPGDGGTMVGGPVLT
jgi:hypothetical protein